MLVNNRDYKRYSMVALVLVATGICGGVQLAQAQSDATHRLKVLSESFNAADLDQIRGLINSGANVNVRNKFGVTTLWMASQNGYPQVVKLFIEAKADVDAARDDALVPSPEPVADQLRGRFPKPVQQ